MADPLYWLTVVHLIVISVLLVFIYKTDQEINCGKSAKIEMYGNQNDARKFFQMIKRMNQRTTMVSWGQALRVHWTYGGHISILSLTE